MSDDGDESSSSSERQSERQFSSGEGGNETSSRSQRGYEEDSGISCKVYTSDLKADFVRKAHKIYKIK